MTFNLVLLLIPLLLIIGAFAIAGSLFLLKKCLFDYPFDIAYYICKKIRYDKVVEKEQIDSQINWDISYSKCSQQQGELRRRYLELDDEIYKGNTFLEWLIRVLFISLFIAVPLFIGDLCGVEYIFEFRLL